MPASAAASARRVLSALEQYGLLLEADARLPSIASLVAGGPITGSWWGHPAGRAIFAVAASLASSPDSLVTKLVSAKITYVHRRLWLSAYAVATAREAWQTAGLSPTARALLRDVDRRGEIRLDRWTGATSSGGAATDAARELEQRLVVHAESVHTEAGAHAKRLETWERWAARAGFVPDRQDAAEARRTLETIVDGLNAAFGGSGRLPWIRRGRRPGG